MANKIKEQPTLVRLKIGYNDLLVPLARAQAVLEMLEGALVYETEAYVGEGKDNADPDGYTIKNVRKAKINVAMFDRELVEAALIAQRLEEVNKESK